MGLFTKTPKSTAENGKTQGSETDFSIHEKPDTKIIFIVGLVGLGIIFLSTVFCGITEEMKRVDYPNLFPYPYFRGFLHLCRDIGIATLSAAILAWAIEFSGLIDFTRKTLIKALTSSEYLEKMEEAGLIKVKDHCNQLIWQKRGHRKEDNLNQSLLKFETELSKHLSMPYYEYYYIDIDCEDVKQAEVASLGLPDDCKVIKKIMRTNYTLINPKMDQGEELVRFSVNLYCPDEIKDPTKLISVVKFSYRADNEKQKNITSELKYIDNKDYDYSQHPKYNKQLTLIGQDDKPYIIKYDDKLLIELEEIRYIPQPDSIFSRKMSKAAKNATLNYSYKSDNVTLKADSFVTSFNLTSGNTGIFIREKENSVSIESREWLLPGNGFLVVHMPT